ncbi:MAG: LysM peptidoglycan-binding domain-containing protein [Chloroflexi bacterium]|nr:LysM peptidoglycan-binding domain-containing protein [Chloroflexota bacterium]
MKPTAARAITIGLIVILAGCKSQANDQFPTLVATPPSVPTQEATEIVVLPGELVNYIAQSGDTLSALAGHFNTSIAEILDANPEVPTDLTTLPKGLPLRIPAYLLPLTGSDFHVIPDSELVNGPSALSFNVAEEIQKRSGYLSKLSNYIYARQRPAWEIIQIVATEYSLHPRLLLTLLEYRSNALSDNDPGAGQSSDPLGIEEPLVQGLYNQLQWVAEHLNQGYYAWREGAIQDLETLDGLIIRPDPWQNAGTVALYNLFAHWYGLSELNSALNPEGFYETFRALWGDPFDYEIELIPSNLEQPLLSLPFQPGIVWDYSSGPHSTWGKSLPLGAIDLAPPAAEGGCAESDVWIAAPTSGRIVRSGRSAVLLDMDGDGDERTGWVLFFYHVAEEDRVVEGVDVALGGMIGHPSCEGGRATGTHFHYARKYKGEWIPAGGILAFEMDGWIVANGDEPFLGTMSKGSVTVEACICTSSANQIIYQFP